MPEDFTLPEGAICLKFTCTPDGILPVAVMEIQENFNGPGNDEMTLCVWSDWTGWGTPISWLFGPVENLHDSVQEAIEPQEAAYMRHVVMLTDAAKEAADEVRDYVINTAKSKRLDQELLRWEQAQAETEVAS